MNKCMLIGRLTRDPEIRVTQGETPVTIARYSLAVDRRFHRDGEQAVDFINCLTFSKNAEFAGKYLHKGTKVAVVGRIQTGSYTKEDGTKVYTTDIVVEEHEFAESKAAQAAQTSSSTTQAQTQAAPQATVQTTASKADNPFASVAEENPFATTDDNPFASVGEDNPFA